MRLAANTYQLNVGLGQAEAVSRLQTYRDEHCVTLVHDRSTLNNHIVTDDDLLAIFGALGDLHHLQKLRVDFIGRPLRLPVRALTSVLQRSTELTKLVLEEIRLSGSVEELEALADAFKSHQSLEIVDLHCCVPADGVETTLDPVVSALAQVPTLTEVLLRDSRIAPRSMTANLDNLGNIDDDDDDDNAMDESTANNNAGWAGTSLTALCQSTSLRILTLRDMAEIRDQHLELMAESLRTNDTLRELTICSTHLGERSGRAMGQVLQTNRRLQKLEIQLNSGEHAIPITEVLQANSSLKRLDLFFNGSISPRIREAFTEMLRRNYVLLDLNGSVWRGQSNSEIDFYLRLNRAGRGDLLTEHATRKQWVETMISQRGDLSILFSILSMNPSIFLQDANDFRDVSNPGGVHGTSLHLRKRRKGTEFS